MSTSVVVNSFQKFFANDGVTVLSGGELTFFDNGTTNLASIFSDAALSVAQSNPYTLDAGGRIQGDVRFAGLMSILIKDSTAAVQRTDDDMQCYVPNSSFAEWESGTTYAIEDIVRGSDDLYYISIAASNLGNDPISTATKWSELNLTRVFNTNETYAIGDIVKASDNKLYRALVSQAGNTPVGDPVNWGEISTLPTDAVRGTEIAGQGSSFDVTLINDLDATVLAIPTGMTNVDVVGDLTALTVNADGTVSAGDLAAMGFSSANGLEWTGQGSTNDWNLFNDAKSSVIRCPTGTITPIFAGVADFSAAGFQLGNETLSVYNVGTFTPNLSDGTNTDATLTTATGRFVQIGALVHITIHIVTSSIGSLSGTIRVTGLPVTSSSDAGAQWAIVGGQGLGLAITGNSSAIGMIGASTTEMLLHLWDSTGGTSGMTAAEWSSNGQLTFSGFYEA